MDIHYGLLILITFGAAFQQGFSGFGFGIMVMAALSFLGADLERASVFSTMTSMILVSTLLLRSRAHMRVDWKQAFLLGTGIVVTIPLGYRFVLHYGEMPVCRIVFGIVLVWFAADRLLKPHIRRHISNVFAPFFGIFSGFLSGAFSTGGPPVVMYLYAQEEDPRMAVGTTQAVFLFGNLYRLIFIIGGERGISAELFAQAFLMLPVIVVAMLLGFHIARRVSLRPFLLAVYGLIILAGGIHLVRGITSLFLK